MQKARKTLAIFLTICFLLSTTIVMTLPNTVKAAGPAVSVNVDWNTVASNATGWNYGLNVFQAFNPDVSGDAVYNSHLAYMKPGMIRFHSWEMLNNTEDANPDNARNAWLNYTTKTWDAAKVHAALANLQANNPEIMINIPGWPDWMDVNTDGILDNEFKDDFIDLCADLVSIVNVQFGHGIVYWEATNERDGKYYADQVTADPPVADHLDELIDLYNDCAKAMKAVDPTIKVGGPAFMRPDLLNGVTRFVQGTLSETNPTTLDFLSYHFYASGDMNESDQTIYDRPLDLETNTRQLRDILDANSGGRHIPLFADEYNISWVWTNNDPRMHSEKGAVYDTLSMIYALRGGADATMAWNEYDGVYGKMYGEDYSFNPNAHSFQLMNNFMVGNVVSAASDDESKVVAYAVKNPVSGAKSYMLVNRTNEVQSVDTDFASWTPSLPTAKMHQIAADGYSYKSIKWGDILTGSYVLPANSVTVWTDSGTNPSILPAAETRKDISVTDWYDTSKAMKYQDADGNWPNQFVYHGSSWINLYGGGGAWDNNPDDYATFKFYGKQVIFYGQLATDGGIGAISIDGGEETLLDFYSATGADYGAVYTSPVLPMGVHEIKIRATGEKHPDSADSYIGVQGVDVVSDGKDFPSVPQSYNDNHWGSEYNQFNYTGTWSKELNKPHAFGNDLNYSTTSGDYYTFKFYGTGVEWYSRKNTNYGIVDIYIDDIKEATVDTYAPASEMSAMLFSKTGLVLGEHTLKVVNTGTKNDASADIKVIADRVDVLPYGSVPPPAATGGGMPEGAFLSGSVGASPSALDLTEEGTLDWAFWGHDGASIHKSGGTMISDVTRVIKEGSTGLDTLVTDETDGKSVALSWSDGALYDGTPVAAGSSYKALAMYGDPNPNPNTDEGRKGNETHYNEGVQFTVPADTAARTLKIYAGVLGSKQKIYAHLSDGSAADLTPLMVNSDGGSTANAVTINYRAGSDGQTLTVQCLYNWDHWGNQMWVQAATLYDADLEAPTQPAGLALASASDTSVALDWNASTDNIGVAEYDVYVNNRIKIASAKGETSCYIKGLEPGTSYDFTVIAKDEVGNQSIPSAVLTAVTAADTTAPTKPDVVLEGRGNTTVSLSWFSIDDIGVVSYDIYRNGTKITTQTSTVYSDSGLSPATNYVYRIVAADTAGNASSESVLSVSTTGSTPGGGSIPPPTLPEATPSPANPEPGTVDVKPELGEDGTAMAEVTSKDLQTALQADKEVTIKLEKVDGADAYQPSLPADVFSSGSGDVRLKIDTPLGEITLPGNMFKADDIADALKVGVSIGMADTSVLSDELKDVLKNKPVIELKALVDGKSIQWNNPDAPVTVSIDYTPNAEELKDPEHITVWYIDGSGKAISVPNAKFDPTTGKVAFTTNHFSTYAVAFVRKAFSDLDSYASVRKEIEVLASKGIVLGVSADRYGPGLSITRGDAVVMLVRALGLSAVPDTGFSDVRATDSCYQAVGIAKKLGVVKGVGANNFRPRDKITRQDMMVIVKRAMDIVKKNNGKGNAADLAKFQDISDIKPDAVDAVAYLVKEGIVTGDGKRIYPRKEISRAEMAVILYRLINKI